MLACKPQATPLVVKEKLEEEYGGKKWMLIGNLLYLTAKRPYIMLAASMLSRFIKSPRNFHFGASKRVVLRYFQRAQNFRIKFKKNSEVKMLGQVVLMT